MKAEILFLVPLEDILWQPSCVHLAPKSTKTFFFLIKHGTVKKVMEPIFNILLWIPSLTLSLKGP